MIRAHTSVGPVTSRGTDAYNTLLPRRDPPIVYAQNVTAILCPLHELHCAFMESSQKGVLICAPMCNKSTTALATMIWPSPIHAGAWNTQAVETSQAPIPLSSM